METVTQLLTDNLNVDRFRNGDLIPEARTNKQWIKAGKNKQPAWCYYNNDPTNGEKYGKLYNSYAVNDPRGLAPQGCYIPTKEEMKTLKEEFKSGLAGGCRLYDGFFYAIGLNGYYWSFAEVDTYHACYTYLYYLSSYLGLSIGDKMFGFSVRCVKEEDF